MKLEKGGLSSTSLAALVIDDDASMLEIVTDVLRDLGLLRITRASSAMNALQHFKTTLRPFDLIICDWMMPDLSGLEFLRYVRKGDQKTPFLMLTSRISREDIVAAKEAGVTDYIAKPFTSADLSRKVLTLMGAKAEAARGKR